MRGKLKCIIESVVQAGGQQRRTTLYPLFPQSSYPYRREREKRVDQNSPDTDQRFPNATLHSPNALQRRHFVCCCPSNAHMFLSRSIALSRHRSKAAKVAALTTIIFGVSSKTFTSGFVIRTVQTLSSNPTQTKSILGSDCCPSPFLRSKYSSCRSSSQLTMPSQRNSNTEEEISTFVSTSTPVHKQHIPKWMLKERTRMLTSEEIKLGDKVKGKSVVYWMQRDVRTVDNWALLYAGYLAETFKVPLHVIHVLPPPPSSGNSDDMEDEDGDPIIPSLVNMQMTERHGQFLLGGLESVSNELKEKSVPLHVLMPLSHRLVGETVYSQIVEEHNPEVVICDFSPLRHIRQWMECQTLPLLTKLQIPMWQVDTHNVVPVWYASDKRQVGARTLRPKIHKLLSDCLQKFPSFKGNDHITTAKSMPTLLEFKRDGYEDFLQMDTSVTAIDWAKPGTDEGKKQFVRFIERGLPKYDTHRNDPTNRNISSDMSPWLNHGHISFQRLTMAIKKQNKYAAGSASFIEEGLIRRELSDNMLYYSPYDYDELTTAAGWAQDTLQIHSTDKREYLYTIDELEVAETHDDLWNAAQLQVINEGRMHGFLRMYWAKKILEWTKSPEYALKSAQYLNDKYALDGKDPNGFVGVGWSIMGIHDQGWKERDIFGKIRYMNYAGCKRKFKVATFVNRYKGASENAIKAESKHKQNSKKKKTIESSSRGKKRKLVQSS